MTINELIEVLEQYKDSEREVFLRDSDGDLNTLWSDNVTVDKDGDLILNVKW